MNSIDRLKKHRIGRLAPALLALCLACAAALSPAAPREPAPEEGIRAGQPHAIYYGIPGYGFGHRLVGEAGIQVLLYTDLMSPPERLPMTATNGIWEASFTLRDTSVTMILLAFAAADSLGIPVEKMVDDNDGNGWDLLVVDASGAPVRGAFEARALSYTGYGSIRPENLGQALSEIQEELRRFPDNYSARLLGYTIRLKQEAYANTTRRRISEETKSLLDEKPEDSEAIRFAVDAYRMIGENEKASQWEQALLRLNPRGEQAARKAFEEILRVGEPADRLQRLAEFRQTFPDSRMTEYALSSMATAAIELGDSLTMVETGDALLERGTTPAAASGLAGIAGVFSEQSRKLPRAEAYIRRALHLIRAGSVAPPPQVTAADWEEQVRSTEARYRDILGWILVQRGDGEQGIRELLLATEQLSQPGVYYHLAKAYEGAGDTENALVHYARATAFGGEDSEAYDAFEYLWYLQRPSDSMELFLREQADVVDSRYREKILSGEIHLPAPEFELEDLYGDWIRLSDQRGSVTLLCFWASWSESSSVLIEELKKLSIDFGRDVLFLTITVDVGEEDIRNFIRETRMRFPVMLSAGTDKDFNLQGVPTLYVIDAEGVIRFVHRGYRPDIRRVLSVELEELL